MAFLALQSNSTQILSFNIRNDEYLPSTALPIFRSPEHAMEFRDSVFKISDTRSFLWTVSICRQSNEATFETRIQRNKHSVMLSDIQPQHFDINDDWLIDELITRKIGCFAIDSHHFNIGLDTLTVDGSIWVPYNINE